MHQVFNESKWISKVSFIRSTQFDTPNNMKGTNSNK